VSISDPSAHYGVSDAFLDNLNKLALQDSSWWRDVLTRDDVFIAVRNKSLDVYYRGASIFQIRDVGNGTVKPNTHIKYLVRQQEARVELNPDNKFDLSENGEVAWNYYEGRETLNDMLGAARSLAGLEKSGLHPLIVGSDNVIDVEVALRTAQSELGQTPPDQDGDQTTKSYNSLDRLDAATLEERGDDIYVVFHEAKHFSNPELAAKPGNAPKIIDQIRRYRSTIQHHEASLTDRYRSVCRILERLNAMRQQVRKSPDHNPLVHQAAQKDVRLGIDPNPRLIVFGFDADQRDGRWTAYLENIAEAEPSLHVYAAGNPGTATGAFRPPTSKRVK